VTNEARTHHHSGGDRFDDPDRSFGHMIVVSHLTGFGIVFALMLALFLTVASGIAHWAADFAGLGVGGQGESWDRSSPSVPGPPTATTSTTRSSAIQVRRR
jgi:hypothetical protein